MLIVCHYKVEEALYTIMLCTTQKPKCFFSFLLSILGYVSSSVHVMYISLYCYYVSCQSTVECVARCQNIITNVVGHKGNSMHSEKCHFVLISQRMIFANMATMMRQMMLRPLHLYPLSSTCQWSGSLHLSLSRQQITSVTSFLACNGKLLKITYNPFI